MKHHTFIDSISTKTCRRAAPIVTVVLLLAGLLAAPRAGHAQIIVSGPETPTTQALNTWYAHLPACFQAKDKITLYPLDDHAMDDYLKGIGLKDGTSYASVNDGGEIDGLFVDKQRRISLRISPTGTMDMETLTHEYGHYVWYHLFSKDDRKQYRGIYKTSSQAKCLVTDYASTNLEEGFAEAFAYYFTDSATLQQKDPASYKFIAAWAAAATPMAPSGGLPTGEQGPAAETRIVVPGEGTQVLASPTRTTAATTVPLAASAADVVPAPVLTP